MPVLVTCSPTGTERRDVTVQLKEAHVIFSCPAVSGQRLGLGLYDYKSAAMGRVFLCAMKSSKPLLVEIVPPCLYSWKGGVIWDHLGVLDGLTP